MLLSEVVHWRYTKLSKLKKAQKKTRSNQKSLYSIYLSYTHCPLWYIYDLYHKGDLLLTFNCTTVINLNRTTSITASTLLTSSNFTLDWAITTSHYCCGYHVNHNLPFYHFTFVNKFLSLNWLIDSVLYNQPINIGHLSHFISRHLSAQILLSSTRFSTVKEHPAACLSFLYTNWKKYVQVQLFVFIISAILNSDILFI